VTGIAITGDDAANYSLLNTTAATTASITKRDLTVTADDKTKECGTTPDPELTYQVTSGSLVDGDSFSGGLIREAGEGVGDYAIRQGTLTAGDNYDLTFIPGTFHIIDTIAPVTLASGWDQGTWYASPVMVTLNATDSGSGVSATYYRVDGAPGGAFELYDASNKPVVASEGEHTLYFYSTDIAGNREETKTATIRIDTTPPTFAPSKTPAADWTNQNVTVTAHASDQGGSGLASVSYVVSKGGTEYASGNGDTVTITEEGTYTVVFTATDKAGNQATSDPVTVQIDRTAPTLNPTKGPDADWTKQNVTVTAHASDQGGSGLASVSYAVSKDGTPYDSGDGGSVTITEEGTYTVVFSATDTAGNQATSDPVTVQIDRTAPVTTATSSATGWTNADEVTVTLKATDAGVGGVTTYYTVNNGGPQMYDGPLSFTAEGVSTVEYWSVDALGNAETPKSVTVKIDRTAPVTTATSSATGWTNADKVTVTFTASDRPTGDHAGVDYTEYSLDGGNWLTGTSVDVTNEGVHDIAYRSVDKAGNTEIAKTITVKIDRTAPTIAITTPQDGATYLLNAKVAASWSASDGASGIGSAAGTVANGQFIDTSTVGQKTFTVTATDKAGNQATKTVTYNVVYSHGVDFLPPVNPDGTSCFKLGSTVPIKFQLTDASGAYVSTAVATLEVTYVDPSTGNEVTEDVVSTSAATSGNLFRYDPTSNQYIFNMGTKRYKVGTYIILARLDDGSTIQETIRLR